MPLLRRLVRYLLVIIVPPGVAIVVCWGILLGGRSEERCFRDLDLDTPGLICATGITLTVLGVLLSVLHVLVITPLALMFGGRVRAAVLSRETLYRRAIWTTGLSVAALLSLSLMGSGGDLPDALLDSAELAIPLIVAVAFAIRIAMGPPASQVPRT